jgi:hypothetical protein
LEGKGVGGETQHAALVGTACTWNMNRMLARRSLIARLK